MFRNLLNNVTKKPYMLYHLHQRANCNIYQTPVKDSKFQKISSLLSNCGFNPGQVNRILKSPASIVSFDEDELMLSFTNWLSFNVNDKLYTVISAYPELLTLNPEFVNARAKELMSLFTKKDIGKLLITCPNVFIEDFSNIYDKVEYIVHMMGVEQNSIVKARALRHDLLSIKCRHIFITRAGRFVVNKKAVRKKNPPLNVILSTNMEKFLKLTKLTEEEYNVFFYMYKEEILDQEESDDEGYYHNYLGSSSKK